MSRHNQYCNECHHHGHNALNCPQREAQWKRQQEQARKILASCGLHKFDVLAIRKRFESA